MVRSFLLIIALFAFCFGNAPLFSAPHGKYTEQGGCGCKKKKKRGEYVMIKKAPKEPKN